MLPNDAARYSVTNRLIRALEVHHYPRTDEIADARERLRSALEAIPEGASPEVAFDLRERALLVFEAVAGR
jgi:hypothetical protein